MESKSIYSHLKPFLPEHVAYTNRFRFYRYACPSWGRKTVAEGVRGGNCECEDAQDKPVLPDSPRATLVLWTSLARLPIKNESVRNTRRRRRLETFLRFTVQSNFHRLRHPNRFREILCKTLRKRCELSTTDNMKRLNSTHVTMEIFSPMKSEKEVRSKFQIGTRDANEWRICRSNRSVDRQRNSSGYV